MPKATKLKVHVKLSKTQKISENSWFIDKDKINKETWDLNVNNPNNVEIIDNRSLKEIILEIEKLDSKSNHILNEIKNIIK